MSPHTAARLSRTAPSARPQRLATAAPMRDSVPGMQKCVTAPASTPRLGQQRRHRARHDLHVALVADPALFPGVVVGAVVHAVLVHEVHRLAVRADQPRDAACRGPPAWPRRRRRSASPACCRPWPCARPRRPPACSPCRRRRPARRSAPCCRRAGCRPGPSSAVPTRSCSALATTPAFCRSSKGSVVEASTSCVSVAAVDSRPGSRAPPPRAMVMLSSSQLQIARSPLARPRRPGANQLLAAAMALRCKRARGR